MTQSRRFFPPAISTLALGAAVCTGCAGFLPSPTPDVAAGPHPVDFACCTSPMCYGYYSTCWRPWPEECPTCPPFTRLPDISEPGSPTVPTPADLSPIPAENVPPSAIPIPPTVPGNLDVPPGGGLRSPSDVPPLAPPAPPARPAPTAPTQGAAMLLPPAEIQPPSYAPHVGPVNVPPPGETSSRRHWTESGFVSQPIRLAQPENR